MKTKNILLNLVILTSFILTACGGTPTHEVMMEDDMAVDDMMATEVPMDSAMPVQGSDADEMMASPAWFSVQMTDVNSGQTYSINDLKGKVILVETMAVWCTKCRQQQEQVKALHEQMGENDDFVSIGFDIDPNEDESKLRDFVQSQGFNWTYSVAPAEVSRELASLYGDQFLNPPSTPMFVIDRHGEAHVLPFGVKSADELLSFIQPLLDEGM